MTTRTYTSGIATYITTRVEVTAGGERVDKALPCFSSLVLVPVKILPLPVEFLPRTAWCTMAISPATSEEGSRFESKKEMKEIIHSVNILYDKIK